MVLCRMFTILDQKKEAKMQWLQDPKQNNAIIETVLDVKLLDISGTKGRNICKLKLTNYKTTVR